MKKKEKIEFINSVNSRFLNSRNHGRNGNNWWYPTENTIAYNVKLYGRQKGIDDFRKEMSKRQNDYYSDEMLYDIANEEQNETARMFSDELDASHEVKSGYAGRSGGWLEVNYPNPLTDADELHTDDLNGLYSEAVKLEKLEAKVAGEIKTAHARLLKYLNSDGYASDFVDNLWSDDDIAEIYKGKVKQLLDKLR